MVSLSLTPESIGDLLYRDLKGYKPELTILKLSKMEQMQLICPVCDGITRDAVMCEGGTKCYKCRDSNKFRDNDDVRNSVNCLEAICPLNIRGCHWKGELVKLEEHLTECDQLLLQCSFKCGMTLAKLDVNRHQTNKCQMRELECEYCKEFVLAMNLNDHRVICSAYIKERKGISGINTISDLPPQEMVDLASLLLQFQLLSGKVFDIEDTLEQQKERIEDQTMEIVRLRDISTNQNKQIIDLKVIVEKQNSVIKKMEIENNTTSHICLYIMKVASGEDLTVKEFEHINKFDWEIPNVGDIMRQQAASVEGPTFNLNRYALQCQGYFAAYPGLDIGSLSIGLKSAQKSSLQICYYCIQLVNRENERDSIVEKGKMECVINEDYLYLASFHEDYLSPKFMSENSIKIRIQLIPTEL